MAMDGSVARPRPFLALGLRLATAATLATMSMLVKLAGERGVALAELIFWRQALTLVCVAASAGEKAPTKKKVPMTITVGKLKLLCEKLFKVKADAQQLYYKEPFMGMPELLEPDDYDIAYLGVKDGSSVLVEEKS